MRWPRLRRHLIDIEPNEPYIRPRDVEDDGRLFTSCPTCASVFFSGFVVTGGGELDVEDHRTRCPNGHVVVLSNRDLFYLDGTRPRKARA